MNAIYLLRLVKPQPNMAMDNYIPIVYCIKLMVDLCLPLEDIGFPGPPEGIGAMVSQLGGLHQRRWQDGESFGGSQ